MLRRFIVGVSLSFFVVGATTAQESTEPPPPVAAPRVAVMTEELPRAGAIVVLGAAQPLGFEIAKALSEANKQVTAIVPEGADVTAFEAFKVTIAHADPRDPAKLKEMFTSMPLRAVVTAYDSAAQEPRLGFTGTRNIIDATGAANIPRLVFVSQTGAGDSADALPWYIRILRGDSSAEAGAVEEHLKSSGLDYTVIRAGWSIDAAAGSAAALEQGVAAFTWIANTDLARLVAGAVDAKALGGTTVTAVDPQRAGFLSLLF